MSADPVVTLTVRPDTIVTLSHEKPTWSVPVQYMRASVYVVLESAMGTTLICPLVVPENNDYMRTLVVSVKGPGE